MTSAPPDARAPRRLAPERRRRGDVIAAVALVVLLGVAALVVWRTSPEVATVSTPDTTPLASPQPGGRRARGLRRGVARRRAAPPARRSWPGPPWSPATAALVAGHDADTRAPWPGATGATSRCARSARGSPAPTTATATPSPSTKAAPAGAASSPRSTRAAASAPTPATPTCAPACNSLADGSYVTATGADYLEVWRSDLVRTLEYGDVPTPVQPGKQPRPQCDYGSTAMSSDRIGVIERCPDAPSDRLTVITPDGSKGADTPEVQFSVELPATGAVLVALSGDRAAVAVPGAAAPDRARQGRAAAQPGAPRRARRGAGHVARRRARHRDHRRLPLLLVGGRHHGRARRRARSRPRGHCATRSVPRPRTAPASWRRSATASPTSTPRAARCCARCPCRAPTRPPPCGIAAAGEVVLEQRGPEVVALLPDAPRPATPRSAPPRPVTITPSAASAPRGPGGAVGVDLATTATTAAAACTSSVAAPGPGEPSRSATTHATTSPTTSATIPAASTPDRPRNAPSRRARCRAPPWSARGLAHGTSCAHGSLSGAAARPSGQCRRTSQDPQRGAGRAGKRASGSAPAARSSAATASAAADRSAAATCAASDARSCRHPATCPLGRWCSSTSTQRRRSVRSTPSAYSASARDSRASSAVGGAAGLVVDDDQLVAPPVDAVDPALRDDPADRHRHPLLQPDGVDLGRALGVLGQPAAGAFAVVVGLLGVAEALAVPVPVHEPGRRLRGAPRGRQREERPQRQVHDRAQRARRPRAASGRARAGRGR